MKDTKISMLSGVGSVLPTTNLLFSKSKLNTQCLSMLSELDPEKRDLYITLSHLIGENPTREQLETMGYIFAFDYTNFTPLDTTIKDLKDSLKMTKSYSVSDAVKNSEAFKWWNDIIINCDYVPSESQIKKMESLYNEAIYFLYCVVGDSLLTEKARKKKAIQLEVLKTYEPYFSLSVAYLIICYSILQNLGITAGDLITYMKSSKIGALDVSATPKPSDVSDLIKATALKNEQELKTQTKTSSVSNDVKTYSDVAINLSKELRDWFGKGSSDSNNQVLYYGGTPSSSDFSDNTTTMFLVGGVAIVALLLLTSKKKNNEKK